MKAKSQASVTVKGSKPRVTVKNKKRSPTEKSKAGKKQTRAKKSLQGGTKKTAKKGLPKVEKKTVTQRSSPAAEESSRPKPRRISPKPFVSLSPPPEHLAPFQEMLLRMRRELLADIAGDIRSEAESLGGDIGDVYDMASSDRDKELYRTLGDRERAKINQIEEALMRIQEGTYAVCEECGEEIGLGRLEAMPFTRVCLECQSKLEQEEKTKRFLEEEEDQSFGNVSYPTDLDEE